MYYWRNFWLKRYLLSYFYFRSQNKISKTKISWNHRNWFKIQSRKKNCHLSICCHGFQYSKGSDGYRRHHKFHKLGYHIWHHYRNSLHYHQENIFCCGLFLWMCDISNLPFDGLWSWHNLCIFGFDGRHYSRSFAMGFLYYGKHPYCHSIIGLPLRKLHLAIRKKTSWLEYWRPDSNQVSLLKFFYQIF